jgi:hypothetical protein
LALAAAALGPQARAFDTHRKQQILFAEIPQHTVGDAPFYLVASSTAHLPVAFAIVVGPATIDGSKVTLTGVPGLVIVRAIQGGNLVFQPAVDAIRVIVVKARPLAPRIDEQPAGTTVTIGDAVVLKVRAEGEPAPSLQWRKDGNPVSGAQGQALAIPAASPSDAGTYDVVATNESGRAVSEPARVAVGKRSQSILFQSPAFALAGQPITLSAQASSGLPVQFEVVSGSAVLSAGILTSQSGSVTVQATQPGDSRYEAAAPVMQTFIFAPSATVHTP